MAGVPRRVQIRRPISVDRGKPLMFPSPTGRRPFWWNRGGAFAARQGVLMARRKHLRIVLVVIAVFVAAALTGVRAGQVATGSVAIDSDDIGGVVTGPKGPEAGVWVIAETTGLPTRLIKSVVTDDQGRYLVPDLPRATYDVWVRGYGLVDSPKVPAMPGKALNLT